MAKQRRFSTGFKTKVALEAIPGELTFVEIAKKYDVHPNMIAGWKRRPIEQAAGPLYPSHLILERTTAAVVHKSSLWFV